MSTNYDNWFSQQLITLIQLIEQKAVKNEIEAIISEIQRGLSYGKSDKGSINDLLLKVAEAMIPPVQNNFNFSLKQTQQENVNIDELKAALTNREKNKVINKMSGSLKSLEDFEN